VVRALGVLAASLTCVIALACRPATDGDPATREKDAAHRNMAGESAPACEPCHRDQVERMTSSQMFANAGMIAQIQATWEGSREGMRYAAVPGNPWNVDSSRVVHAPVADLDDLSGELYRKFCSRCHLGRADDDRPAGCAACHSPRGRLESLPPMDACERCHNRSGRTSLSFRGLQDGNNALVPTRDGMPGPIVGSDARTFTHIAPDVHFEAGMECIDCHTSREIMGDGYAHADMAGQIEIRCEDCHGSAVDRPRFLDVTRESDAPIRESRRYARPVRPGARAALTSRGRPYSNVFERGGEVLVVMKRTGKLLRSPVITGTAAHTIAGHERMECTACHSRAVPQCYGCHTTYDKREDAWDFVRDEDSPGAFEETEDYRTLYPFPLALNGRGGIAPVTPGCQTFVSVIEADGRHSLEEAVLRYRGQPQLRFAPFYAHNTAPRAIGCAECHGNPAFLGFGQHVLENGTIRSTLLCERNPNKGLDAFLAMEGGRVVSHAAIARSGARALDHDEVMRVLAVNACLVCHTNANDSIYRAKPQRDARRPAGQLGLGLRPRATEDPICRGRMPFGARRRAAQLSPGLCPGTPDAREERGREGGRSRSALERPPSRPRSASNELTPGTARGQIGWRAIARHESGGLRPHEPRETVLTGPMATRSRERAFAHRAFGPEEGERFFRESCSGCHVSSCADCHGNKVKKRPGNDACLRCHRGYSAGWEFEGKAPREDHSRYRRGPASQGEPYLTMLPDVHFERGMTCADCHPMSSMHVGGRAKTCLDCHPEPSSAIPEHSIAAHMEGMECVACHAAWAPQEYGTFLVRTESDAFAEVRQWGPWAKSAHLKRQDPPPLGVSLSGRVAPIRPRFILFVTDSRRGWENQLLAAEWRVFTPHTIRRGTVACGGCHDQPRRFILEPTAERLYLLEKDGLALRSYWSREGQTVVNGSFLPSDRYARMNVQTPEYTREVVRQWQTVLDRAAPR
jgi:hypothetical protein